MFKIYIDGVDELGSNWELPIPPNKEFKIDVKNDYEEVDIYGLGKVIKKESKGLEKISWSSFLPSINNVHEARIIAGQKINVSLTPEEICEILKKAENMVMTIKINKEEGDEIEPYINKEYILTNFNTKDVFGRVGDIQYTIEFVEYKEPKIYEHPIPQPPIQEVATTTYTYSPSKIDTKENKTPPPSDEYAIGDEIIISSCEATYNAVGRQNNSNKGEKAIKGLYEKALNEVYKRLTNKTGVIRNIDKDGFYTKIEGGKNVSIQTEFYYILLNEPVKDTSIIKQLQKGIGAFDNMIGNTVANVMNYLTGTTVKADASSEVEKIDDVNYIWINKTQSKISKVKD